MVDDLSSPSALLPKFVQYRRKRSKQNLLLLAVDDGRAEAIDGKNSGGLIHALTCVPCPRHAHAMPCYAMPCRAVQSGTCRFSARGPSLFQLGPTKANPTPCFLRRLWVRDNEGRGKKLIKTLDHISRYRNSKAVGWDKHEATIPNIPGKEPGSRSYLRTVSHCLSYNAMARWPWPADIRLVL